MTGRRDLKKCGPATLGRNVTSIVTASLQPASSQTSECARSEIIVASWVFAVLARAHTCIWQHTHAHINDMYLLSCMRRS